MAGLVQKQYQNEDAAREYIEKLLWKNAPVCPHCGVIENIYKLESKPDSKHQLRKGVYKCGGCRKQFTLTVGTIFEGSHIPLHKWLLAFHLMCSSKEGISAFQLQRNLWGENEETGKPNGSYRTAWFMCHRIRWVMTQSPMVEKLSGVIEVDEITWAARKRELASVVHAIPTEQKDGGACSSRAWREGTPPEPLVNKSFSANERITALATAKINLRSPTQSYRTRLQRQGLCFEIFAH